MSMIGKTLGHYSVSALLGKGGMGEVYKAKDEKLGRDVAIKVLPEEFAKDVDRVARFQREAKLLASLNHPNIAAIHGLEESDGTHFLVLELIEGDTLADRLKRGTIPAEESLKLAIQIAEALQAAHERGVIHRDLKPANIKVMPEGKIKVLDFGLAKAFAGEQAEVNLSYSPTLSEAATLQGVILGTAAYMSPEQARGKPVDKRTDIWAFGVVLYEMLTGQSAFQGEDVSVTLASVIKGDANLNLLPPSIHPRVREAITRCLQNDIGRRYSSIADARYEIEQALSDPSGLFVQPVTAAKPREKMRVGIPWLAAATVLSLIVAGIAGWIIKPAPPPEPKQVMRFYHELPEDQRFTQRAVSVVDLSADGTKIVYVANNQLYLRNLKELTAKSIQGTADDNPAIPIFSPDGLWVAYYSEEDNQWKKIEVSGGSPSKICDADPPLGVTWGSDEIILFGAQAGIMSVSANGGTAERLIEPKEGEWLYRPQALPGGEWILFTVRSSDAGSWDEAQIAVQSLKTGERNILVSSGSDARYVPTGHLVYALGNVLHAKVFDADSMEVKGGAVPIVEGVERAWVTGSANYGFSDTGMLAHVVGGEQSTQMRRLVWVDRSGTENPLSAEPRTYIYPRISPDGERVALDVRDQETDIWIWDLAREKITRFTFDPANDQYPLWSPDGEQIGFNSSRTEGVFQIYRKASNNPTSTVELLTESLNTKNEINGYFFTPDNKFLVFREQGGSTQNGDNIGMISLNENLDVKWLLNEEFNERNTELSPDGNWIAYQSDQSGKYEIYVRPFPNVNERLIQISNGGGQWPLWSRNGNELFYIASGNPPHMVAVSIETDPEFDFGPPEKLFEWQYFSFIGRTYDVSLDGKSFLVIDDTPLDQGGIESAPRINIIANWFEELKERVPAD